MKKKGYSMVEINEFSWTSIIYDTSDIRYEIVVKRVKGASISYL